MPALVAAGLERRLPPLADPSIARDFVYVEDVCEAFVCAAERARPGEGAVYNVGGGEQTTLRSLAETARRTFAIDEEPAWEQFPARAWDTDVWVADPRRADAELGWRARTPLAAGLAAFARWMDDQPPPIAERYRAAVGAA